MVERGDAVCLPLYVAGVKGDGVLLASNPNAAKAGRGNAVAMLEEVAPWHDALPKIAAWLAATPDGLDTLRSGLSLALDHPDAGKREMALYDLLAALETGAGK